ncbi:5-formyltetrahydrofolate cyclo-ligase [Formivibrio citricus]|uniref:5-formyltetrahydrofolate cyclo-ligase n=1 Tax=Formivibrio citricus TaxID=83765 RepID=A0A1I4ZGF7_9NEIS|nr:5-formyltetrahydrofolate cyclo-ligase [Formivibrio citricus]SFN49288.1 5-formyltetrahydrofolate cyclo-ligase [Formivibrio citricus]
MREVSLHSVQQLHDKIALRHELRGKRGSMTAAERRKAELGAALQARRNGWLKPGKRIAAYIPVGSEFSSWPLMLLALKLGAEVYVPRVPKNGKQLEFVRLDQHTSWSAGAYGIPEPSHEKTCLPHRLDTVFLPLVGYDDQGFRLGQGGGYYDATFAFRRLRKYWLKPRLIGLGFECQKASHLPVDHWDLKLDAVLSG